jgi:hypothetical protein
VVLKIKPYEETHMAGHITIENLPIDENKEIIRHLEGDLGIQIAEDGRVWICIEGVAFLRFTPTNKYHTVGGKLNPTKVNFN